MPRNDWTNLFKLFASLIIGLCIQLVHFDLVNNEEEGLELMGLLAPLSTGRSLDFTCEDTPMQFVLSEQPRFLSSHLHAAYAADASSSSLDSLDVVSDGSREARLLNGLNIELPSIAASVEE